MKSLILNEDLKSLFSGAALAVMAGLTGGAVMYPDLRGPADAEGPQLKAGVSGARGQSYGQPMASWASYDGKVPDYVIGTDWLRAQEYPEYAEAEYGDETASEEETVVYAAATGDTTEAVAAVAWEEPRREPVTYPSTNGGVPYDADLPKPPAPPAAEDDLEQADLHAANPG